MAGSPSASARFPTAEELESQPCKVQIVATRVDGDYEDPAYILTCVTPRGDLWPILRRFNRFKALRDALLKDENPALKALPFPDRKLLGGSIGDALGEAGAKIFGGGPFGLMSTQSRAGEERADDGESTPEVQRRREMLEQWINETLELCPADSTLLEFLGDDNSITTTEARKLGIEVVSSAPCRTVTEDSHGDPVALAEHKKRQERHNKQLLAALDAAPVRVSVALSRVPRSGATGLVPIPTDSTPASAPLTTSQPAPERASEPAPAPAPAPAPPPTAEESSGSSGWGSAFASFKQALSTVEDSVSSGLSAIQKEVQDFSAAARVEIESGIGPSWSAYVIQCFCADGEYWHVRRSLTEVIKLRNTLLKDGNPAVRAMDTEFPSKLQDAAVMLRPSFVDDDAEDAVERRAAIEAWLNEALEACVGEPTIEAFLSRQSRLTEFTALVRSPLCEELPVPTKVNSDSTSTSSRGEANVGTEDTSQEATGSLAVEAGQRFTVTRCVAVEGRGHWARCDQAGLVGWLCAQAVDGTEIVSVEPPEQDEEESGSETSETSGEYSSEYETDTEEEEEEEGNQEEQEAEAEEEEEEIAEEAGANAEGELTMEASAAADEVRQAQAARQEKQRRKQEEKAQEDAQDGAASGTGCSDGAAPAIAPTPTQSITAEPQKPEPKSTDIPETGGEQQGKHAEVAQTAEPAALNELDDSIGEYKPTGTTAGTDAADNDDDELLE